MTHMSKAMYQQGSQYSQFIALGRSVGRRIMPCTNILGLGAEHSFTTIYNGLRERHKHYARTQVFVIAEENSGPLYH